MGTIYISVLTREVTTPSPTRTPRVNTIKFLVPEQGMETWLSKVAMESATATALASAMASTLLDSLSEVDING